LAELQSTHVHLSNGSSPLDLVIVGGAGHVGLPLALSFAYSGCRVGVYDVDVEKMERIGRGEMPFMEGGAEELLPQVLATGRLTLSADAAILSRTETVVLIIGTPIDEFLNPSTRVFHRVVEDLGPHMRPGSLVVLRSTVYPGTTHYVADRLRARGVTADVAFCPERVSEGAALEEIRSLPQLIGADDDRAFDRASELFQRLDVEIVRTTAAEAELAKLLTNTWRYMKFAIANQFFQIAESAGIDYNQVLRAIRHNYPRASDLPAPGFAAGPCLLKDTMQLAAFCSDHFPMGHAAMLVNEGLPGYIVDRLNDGTPLRGRTVGILGMAFKGESDDPRTSLSYKLKKLLAFRGAIVLTSDPYVQDPDLLPQDVLLARADVVVIGAPHRAYRDIQPIGTRLVDIWGLTGHGIRL
jgi:UDP-N-acetyl-D-mannosaminuronic acid dehydrogenase